MRLKSCRVPQPRRVRIRKLLSVSEVLDISPAPSSLAGPLRAWTAAAASETRGRSAAREDPLSSPHGASRILQVWPASDGVGWPHEAVSRQSASTHNAEERELRGGRELPPAPRPNEIEVSIVPLAPSLDVRLHVLHHASRTYEARTPRRRTDAPP